MNGIGISYGINGATTIVATVYMMEHGFAWWQIAIVFLIGMSFLPRYTKRAGDAE